jgi:hypothetical protein
LRKLDKLVLDGTGETTTPKSALVGTSREVVADAALFDELRSLEKL